MFKNPGRGLQKYSFAYEDISLKPMKSYMRWGEYIKAFLEMRKKNNTRSVTVVVH